MTEPDIIVASIEKALDLNLKLQHDIGSRLRLISILKQNLLISLHQCTCENAESDEKLQGGTISGDSVDCGGFNIDAKIHLNASSIDGNKSGNIKSRKMKKSSKIPATTSKNRSSRTKNIRGWRFNKKRKWTRRFFFDPYQSTPKPNADTIQRRQWEGDLIGNGSYRYNPWSRQELQLLLTCAEERRQQQVTDETKLVKDVDINFDEVAKLIEQKLSKRELTTNQIRKIQSDSYSSCDQAPNNGTIQLRLCADYRNKFLSTLSPSINKSPFTEEESNKIIDFINRYSYNPPWNRVARFLDNSRTPFQCFKYAQRKRSTTVGTLNELEDQLLFTYIAASGPQLVLNHHTATNLSQQLFPNLSTGQILIRANTSINVNPNYNSERWSGSEERMLVLGMRAYCDDAFSISKVSVSFGIVHIEYTQ